MANGPTTTPAPPALSFPAAPRPPVRVNPRILVLIGPNKIRKTVTCSKLPDSMLLELDPGGADHIEARVFDLRSELERAVAAKLVPASTTELTFLVDRVIPALKRDRPAKRLVIDTWDLVEDWVLDEIDSRRRKTLLDNGIDTVLELGYGKGEAMIQKAMSAIWVQLELCAHELVFIIHSRDNLMDRPLGGGTEQVVDIREVRSGDIDLRGARGRKMPCKLGTCIGKLTQRCPDAFTDQLIVTFRSNPDTATGNRILRLEETEFVLSECKYASAKGPNGPVRVIDPVTHEPRLEYFRCYWDRIYLKEPEVTPSYNIPTRNSATPTDGTPIAGSK